MSLTAQQIAASAGDLAVLASDLEPRPPPPVRASEATSPATILVLPVGAQRYALAREAAREVLAPPEATPLPGAPAALVGLCNVRGEIVPLFDLALLHHRGMVTAPAFAVVVDAGAELAGFVTTARPWVGEGRPTAQPGRLRVREGRRQVSAALLDVAALLPLDPTGLARDTPAGAPLDPATAGRDTPSAAPLDPSSPARDTPSAAPLASGGDR